MKSLAEISFPDIADRVCALYDEQQDALLLGMLGQEYVVRHNGVMLRGQKAPEAHAGVIIDYLQCSGQKAVLTPWRSLGDFNGALQPGFRERVELPITHYAAELISRAGALLPMVEGSTAASIIGSDLALEVRALPNVYLHVEVSQESQEFPAEAWVLFSRNADEFLTLSSLQTLAELFKDRLVSLLRIY